MATAGASKFAVKIPPQKEIHAFEANEEIGTCNN
jgi:hypothetical protein